MRFVLLLTMLAASLSLSALEITAIKSPAAPGAMGPSMCTDRDGKVLLSWLESIENGGWALKFARFNALVSRWDETREIARGTNWLANWADFPSVTSVGDDQLLALWFVNNAATGHSDGHGHGHGAGYHAVFSRSDDHGVTWSTPKPLTSESQTNEFAVVAPHADQLAAWLDGRARNTNGGFQQLFARSVQGTAQDMLVDPSVCDCCQLSLVLVPDGALLAYRGRTADEIRDIRLARWRNGAWEAPRPLHDDGWKIAGCPVNGPRLATHGSRVAAVWFTAAQNKQRVQLKISADGGDTFGAPHQLDLGRPLGRVDVVWLSDELGVATWLETKSPDGTRLGGVYLRTFTPDGTLTKPQLLAASGNSRATGFLRLAKLDATTLLAVYTVASKPTSVETIKVQVK